MRILAVDVGTGTQDILLFDSTSLVENCIKMIMPSPTALVAERISRATESGRPILFTGLTMGGGPCKRALSRHTARGLKAYATVEAALTFHDNLDTVKNMGVAIVGPDEATGVAGAETIRMADVDLGAIRSAVGSFGVASDFDALAVAVLDHGFAPPGVSNRAFRFDHLRRLMAQRNTLVEFAYLSHELPDYLTRMKAVAGGVDVDVPVLLVDTGVAAALGVLRDTGVSGNEHVVAVNAGNSHTIALHLDGNTILGLFEHHTNLLNPAHLDELVSRLVGGTLTNEEVYEAGGHGAVVVRAEKRQPLVAVTGPRRGLMSGSSLRPHMGVPYGDTMLAGCYGLVSACGLRMEAWRDEIEQALSGVASGQ